MMKRIRHLFVKMFREDVYMSKLHEDFTQGSISGHLIRFSLPYLMANLLQALYSVADMLIVSWICGTNSMSGVNIGGQVTQLIMMMVSGLTVGGTVLVGQYYGARQHEEVKRTIGTLLTLLTAMGIILMVVMLMLCDPLLRLLNTPAESFSEAHNYLMISLSGMPFVFWYNALAAMQRGLGDGKRPLIFVGIACVVNVGLDMLMVGTWGMGASGAALATVISQSISVLLCVIYLKTHEFVFDFKLSSLRVHMDKVRMLIKIGLPSSVQSVVTNLSFLIMTTIVNGFGVTASAAVAVCGKFNSFGIMPAIAMSSSVSSLAAQNIGAGHYDRAQDALKVGMRISAVIGVAVFAFTQLFPELILKMFNAEDEVVAYGVTYLRAFSFDYLIVPFVFCINGLVLGAGHSMFSLVNNMLSAILLRVPVAYFVSKTALGLAGVGAAAPAASLCSLCLGTWFLLSGRWRSSSTGIHREQNGESA